MVTILTSVSLPLELFHKIDQKRGKIPRSRYCRKLIEIGLEKIEVEN